MKTDVAFCTLCGLLTLYSLTSVCILSILLQGEFDLVQGLYCKQKIDSYS